MTDTISFELTNEAAAQRNPQLHVDGMMSLWVDEDRPVCSEDAIELFGRACYAPSAVALIAALAAELEAAESRLRHAEEKLAFWRETLLREAIALNDIDDATEAEWFSAYCLAA
ncbi:hypothetical protein JYP49_05010 [Nitratireductor aquimarinus]|uniref:hypothetical protein n=1 Tax=Nitratireductor TaxID=245876 RepID=UPI0019D403AF|nr:MULTISPECIES: hypothetical protein [Nitratireductor]MBN7775080.1 hypothetical protein [Nitratireductor pacificus]MBN7779941.1 hypothetical protein [Nitratireductor pacificus]MBN7788748.1 hypothetical protein [Nitratireductor aquimarinus]MBY6097467.1 hypothetical protein [Nitratireductor aquimarinus]MCA1260888.1 hypothetical protein [Nitratireductor aquimarinus]